MAYCLGYSSNSESCLASKVDSEEVTDGEKVSMLSTTQQIIISPIRGTFPQITVKDVVEVKNTYLKGMYELKKEEYKAMGKVVNERQLYHVTSAANVDSIIKNNFDWRRVKRGRFGLGTSFSGDAQYADKYAHADGSIDRAIIVCNVLTSRIYPISDTRYNMKVPPAPYDTTQGNSGKVYVKFDDNEFLPLYVVYYKAPSSHRPSRRRFNNFDDDYDMMEFNDNFDDDYDLMEFNDHFDSDIDNYIDLFYEW